MGSVGSVVVVGSINADLVLRVAHRPRAGETLLADAVDEGCGGKGANQAVAAARAGATVSMLGAVGADERGRAQLAALQAHGVDTSLVAVREDLPTGLAAIVVTPDGENSIIVASGANATVSITAAPRADVALAQGEIPAATVDSAAQLGGRFVLNLAPVIAVEERTLAAADPLIVNAGEAAELLARWGAAPDDDFAATLRERVGCRSVVVTRGADGADVASASGSTHVPAPAVEPVDTTGAGDVLAGTLAAALSAGAELVDAVRVAVAAAAESVTRPGAR